MLPLEELGDPECEGLVRVVTGAGLDPGPLGAGAPEIGIIAGWSAGVLGLTFQRWGASWNLANLASLDALRGDEQRARDHADEALQLATASGAAFIVGFAHRALALLDLTLGRAGEAMENRHDPGV